jgi:hypothetical protein
LETIADKFSDKKDFTNTELNNILNEIIIYLKDNLTHLENEAFEPEFSFTINNINFTQKRKYHTTSLHFQSNIDKLLFQATHELPYFHFNCIHTPNLFSIGSLNKQEMEILFSIVTSNVIQQDPINNK